MPLKMTPTALAQGRRNALICGVPVFVIIWIIPAVIAIIFEQPFFLCLGVSAAATLGLCSLVLVMKWLFDRNTGGQILLDFGPFLVPKVSLIGVLCVLFFGLMFGVGTVQGLINGGLATLLSDWFPALGLLTVLSIVPFHLIMGRIRFQIREGGFWCLGNLLPWDKIDSYSWANDGTLLIRRKGFFSPWSKGAIPILPEHKQAVEELLAKHCPACESPPVNC